MNAQEKCLAMNGKVTTAGTTTPLIRTGAEQVSVTVVL